MDNKSSPFYELQDIFSMAYPGYIFSLISNANRARNEVLIN